MDFVKEFSTFLFENKIIQFGEFTLASGKKSSYYVDLRLVPSYPHQFRRMVKNLQNMISSDVGLDNFDSIVSVPTGGLIIASALAIETVKPLIYVRDKPKEYGTSKSIEGKIRDGLKVIMVDDVATTGGSVLNGIQSLKEAKIMIEDAYVIVNRMEGADKSLQDQGVTLHSMVNVLQITENLHQQGLIGNTVLQKIKEQTRVN